MVVTETKTEFINIAAYKFVPLDRLPERKAQLLSLCRELKLKGTILLSSEGINMFLAGSRSGVNSFLDHLRAQPELGDLEVKESFSDHQPFNRMLVRLKKEIISMGVPEIRPRVKTSPKISAQQLKSWLDEGRDIALLDVRNDYEVEIGTFENAIPVGVDHFRNFPDAIDRLPSECRERPLVMFCTGGIRCEKAGPMMEAKGFEEIYQLDGGILKYFEECGGAHYRGDCFVFDKRVALDPQLNETDLLLCFHCQAILTAEDQASEFYLPPDRCNHCHPLARPMNERLALRRSKLRDATAPLPGSRPYRNERPMNVTGQFDRRPLIEFLVSLHAELGAEYWRESCENQRVFYQGEPLSADQIVRAGWRLHHVEPDTVEPSVSNDVKFLYEDEGLIAIDKPAPLPMHPCGRFNKNTLQNFLRLTYSHDTIRILHRLDAETTGVLLLGRNRETAARLQQQFAQRKIHKTYLARVFGQSTTDHFECDAAISIGPVGPGGLRTIVPTRGKSEQALTRFEVAHRFADGTTLLKCIPITGRTNQIRVHLAHLGLPIVGEGQFGSASRKEISGTPEDLDFSRLHLHAYEIEFEYPKGSSMKLTAEAPAWSVYPT